VQLTLPRNIPLLERGAQQYWLKVVLALASILYQNDFKTPIPSPRLSPLTTAVSKKKSILKSSHGKGERPKRDRPTKRQRHLSFEEEQGQNVGNSFGVDEVISLLTDNASEIGVGLANNPTETVESEVEVVAATCVTDGDNSASVLNTDAEAQLILGELTKFQESEAPDSDMVDVSQSRQAREARKKARDNKRKQLRREVLAAV
jgi:hypothetical protein